MKIEIENEFSLKLMRQTFGADSWLKSPEDVRFWRQKWTEALKAWHSPYKALLDISELRIEASPEVIKELALMGRYLKGLFLRQAVAFPATDLGARHLPFELCQTEEEAQLKLGIRARVSRGPGQDLRSQIQIENHFNQHVMELSFLGPTHFETASDIEVLKSKIMNNLMLWHTKWNLLIDSSALSMGPEAGEAFLLMQSFFGKFFLKETIGYGLIKEGQSLPFKVYRARHNAAGRLESEGALAGDEANCRSQVKMSSKKPE